MVLGLTLYLLARVNQVENVNILIYSYAQLIMHSFHSRLVNSNTRIPIRLYLSSESGYYLDITMYKEVLDERLGQVLVFDFSQLFCVWCYWLDCCCCIPGVIGSVNYDCVIMIY